MITVAVTGGIGSGKSTVSTTLRQLGAVVVDSDQLARDVVAPGTPGLAAVAQAFGPAMIDPSGALDRAALAGVVFADPAARTRLERITHPRISALMGERILEALQGATPLVVADIPLLFEKQRDADFEGTLLVYAPAAVQLQRLRERDGLDDSAARGRLAAQLPIDEKRRRATWVIDNGGSRDATAAQVQRWWHEVTRAG